MSSLGSSTDTSLAVLKFILNQSRQAMFAAVSASLLVWPVAVGAAVLDVRVEGLAPDFEQNVRAHLSMVDLAATLDELDDRRPEERYDALELDELDGDLIDEDALEIRIRRLHARAPAEISAALRPFGYYEVGIEASLEPSEDGEWLATYRVSPGPVVRLTDVRIEIIGEGAENPSLRSARDAITLKAGDALRHPVYEAAKQRLFDVAYAAGYIDVSYERAELRIHRARREAEVDLILDTGRRYYFGEITIVQDVLAEAFIDRLMPIEAGEPFDTDRLVNLQIALTDSGYFSEVLIDVEREFADNQHIPVVVRTTPRRTQEYTVGLGYGTDTGPRVSLGVELRRINAYGHRFTSDLRISSIEQAVAAEYQIPRGRNLLTDFLSFRGSLGNQEIGDWDTTQGTVGASWHDAWRTFQRRIYVTASREEFSTPTRPVQRENLFFTGFQLTKKVANDTLFPTRGYSWSVDLRAGSDSLGSSTSFSRLLASGNLVRSFGERVRLLLRSEYGATRADVFDRLPPSQRFFTGGDGSVRGYSYQSIGPRDEDGYHTGGRYMLVASAELEVMVVGNYGAALFIDAGHAGHEPGTSLSRGVGLGVRWRSPVGVIGIDIAHPLDDPETDFRLHVSVGADL